MKRSHARHLRTLLIALGSILLLVLCFNLLIDPYGSVGLLTHSPLANHAAGLGTRIAKAEAIAHQDWDVLLLGDSRVEMGLDPQHPSFAGLRVYNAGLYGADFPELERAAQLAMEHPRLKRIILCVDRAGFDASIPAIPDARQSLLNPEIRPAEYHLANLLSITATQQSIDTIRNAVRHRPGDHSPLGLFVPQTPAPGASRADWNLGAFYNMTIMRMERTSDFEGLSQARLDSLSKLLADAYQKGIRVDVVQLPMHDVCFERLFAENRWPLYEEWLRTLTRLVAKHNRQFPAAHTRLFDFCTYNRFSRDTSAAALQWYYDPFHFKVALGDKVLDQLNAPYSVGPAPRADAATGGDSARNAGPTETEFGVQLTEAVLEDHFARLQRDRAAYIGSHPQVLRLPALK